MPTSYIYGYYVIITIQTNQDYNFWFKTIRGIGGYGYYLK